MVIHAVGRVLRCHHCGAESAIPRACPTCGNVDLKPMGRGTQRVEETLAAAFPGARIVRIDRDSARRRAELSRSEEHTSELQSPCNLVCRLLLEKKKQMHGVRE